MIRSGQSYFNCTMVIVIGKAFNEIKISKKIEENQITKIGICILFFWLIGEPEFSNSYHNY